MEKCFLEWNHDGNVWLFSTHEINIPCLREAKYCAGCGDHKDTSHVLKDFITYNQYTFILLIFKFNHMPVTCTCETTKFRQKTFQFLFLLNKQLNVCLWEGLNKGRKVHGASVNNLSRDSMFPQLSELIRKKKKKIHLWESVQLLDHNIIAKNYI